VDAPASERDWISVSPNELGTIKGASLVGASGQQLKPGSGVNDLEGGTDQVVVFTTADGSPVRHSAFTLDIYGIER